MDQGVATTKVEHIEVFNGSGPEWKGLHRLGGHAQVERILCIHHAYLGVIIAALKTRVRGDLITPPEESGSWERHTAGVSEVYGGHRDGRKALEQGESGGFVRPHTTRYRVYELLEATTYDSGHHLARRWP